MAVCVYTQIYRDVAIKTVLRTALNGLFLGFQSPKTRQVFNEGRRKLEDFESFGKIIQTERNLLLKATVNYLGRKIEEADYSNAPNYRI